jgi:hypothetical protein
MLQFFVAAFSRSRVWSCNESKSRHSGEADCVIMARDVRIGKRVARTTCSSGSAASEAEGGQEGGRRADDPSEFLRMTNRPNCDQEDHGQFGRSPWGLDL